MISSSLPVIRLKPKTQPRAIRHGFPWVYDNELVIDRRTRSLEPGCIAVLEDNERQPMALVAVNPNSRIMARVLDRDMAATIDGAWLKNKIIAALDLRARLYETPFYRLIHAEADGLPGVVIDRFGAVAVIQPNAAWAERLLPELTEALLTHVPGLTTVIKNAGGRTRVLEGLDDVNAVLAGEMPEAPLPVPMNGAIYMADLAQGQKTGLFFDQRANHAFAAGLSKEARVLDIFSHVGGFALAAIAGGASGALAVDGSEAALSLAREGAAQMGCSDQFTTRRGDAFEVMEALREEGQSFDVVICDPPAFAPSKKSLEAGLRAYERVARLASQLVKPGGYLGLCSCSHAVDIARFRTASARGIGRAGRVGQLIHTGQAGPDHPLHLQLAESGYLKALFFRL